ncbi:MAG: nucleotidyltransferase domain-containing protein [Ardenticatenia bacterium]|nr:nucleotidyltransferase domain-containing protein [Ardenticatenia bacterium]
MLQRIRALADRVAEEFQPERIILFGSFVNGEPDADSDVDLLVVMETPMREVDQAIAIGQRWSHDFGLDLIVRTPTNLNRRLALGDWFLREIVDHGQVLYERTHA